MRGPLTATPLLLPSVVLCGLAGARVGKPATGAAKAAAASARPSAGRWGADG